MPIKNYTTVVPANRTITAIQDAPVKHGATGVLYKYEQGTGRIEALQFLLRIKNHDVAFSLPVNWRKFQRVLEIQQVRRWDEEDYVYRVAWRNIRDWVMAQLALYETEIVEMPQVFLPFATDAKGQTLYEKMVEGKCLLGPGPQENSTKKTRCIRLHRVSHTALAETVVPASHRGKIKPNFPWRTLHIQSMPSGISEFKGAENSEALIRLEERIRASD